MYQAGEDLKHFREMDFKCFKSSITINIVEIISPLYMIKELDEGYSTAVVLQVRHHLKTHVRIKAIVAKKVSYSLRGHEI